MNKKHIIAALIIAVITIVIVFVVQKRGPAEEKEMLKDTTYTETEEMSQEEISKDADTEPKEVDQTDTSDWKTYRNEEYGFEVKYPGDWKYQINKLGQGVDGPEELLINVLFSSELWAPISIMIYDSSYVEGMTIGTIKEPIRVSEVDGYKYIYRAEIDPDCEYCHQGKGHIKDISIKVELFNDNRLFQIQYAADYANISYEKVFERMVKEFRFLD